MSTFIKLVRWNILMLSRQRMLIITTLGLAVLSMLIFGGTFGGNGGTQTRLGIVDEDHSPVSTKITSQLQHANSSLIVYTGSYSEEQSALQNGDRDAVIVMGTGFGTQIAQGGAHLQVFYNQGSPITAGTAQLAVQSVVNGINNGVNHLPTPVTLDQQQVSSKNMRTIDYLTPGLLGMMLMWGNLVVGTQLVIWREMGITRRLAATPLKPITMISSQVIARLILSIIQAALLLLLAIKLFSVQIYGNIWLLALLVTLGALTMLAIGFAISCFVKKSEATQAIVLLISFPMMFLGGSYFPVSNAPSVMQPIIHAMPLYYLNQALLQITWNAAGWAAIQTSVLVMLAWIVASMFIVWRAFKWL